MAPKKDFESGPKMDATPIGVERAKDAEKEKSAPTQRQPVTVPAGGFMPPISETTVDPRFPPPETPIESADPGSGSIPPMEYDESELGDGEQTGIGRTPDAGPPAQRPSIGRMVLYTNPGGQKDPYPVTANAAVITRVEPPPLPPEFPPVDADGDPNDPPPIPQDPMKVSLTVFRAMGNLHTLHGVEFTTAEPGSPEARGKWGWPPRV